MFYLQSSDEFPVTHIMKLKLVEKLSDAHTLDEWFQLKQFVKEYAPKYVCILNNKFEFQTNFQEKDFKIRLSKTHGLDEFSLMNESSLNNESVSSQDEMCIGKQESKMSFGAHGTFTSGKFSSQR